jgi:hypothetical protein
MLQYLWWEAGLMIRGWSLTLCEVLVSPVMANSERFNRQMDERWDRLEGDVSRFMLLANRLYRELKVRGGVEDS